MNNKIKRIIPQLLTILFVVFVFGFFTFNAQVNMDNRGIDFGFGFLKQEASFDMQFTLLDYDGQDSYLWAYVVALLNTLLVSFLGIAFAPSIYVLFVYLTLHGVGSALTRSGNVAQLSLSVNKNEQGLINGLLGGVMPLGHLLTPIITMPLYMIAPNYPFIFIAILSVLIIMFINLSKKFTNKLHTGEINV